MNDAFGDRMKAYENMYSERIPPGVPVCVRIDGRAFSKFTRDFQKPADPALTRAMIETTKHLVAETHACIGYTQSDEITLIFYADNSENPNTQIFFDGRIPKLTSVLAGLATVKFSDVLRETHAAAVSQRLPHFDARVWTVPSKAEAANVLLWRAQDARRNGIISACRTLYSPKQMFGRDRYEMLDMMKDAGVYYETTYDIHHRYGTYVRRETRLVELTADELARIPEVHRPEGAVQRSFVEELNIGYWGAVRNQTGVIFGGEVPHNSVVILR